MNKKKLDRFKEFINSIAKDDVVAVLHHTDPDGICSGVIMAKLVEKKRGKKADLRINQGSNDIAIQDSTVEKLRQIKASKVIITDLCVDQIPDNVLEIEKFAEILIIDHHKIYNDLESKKTIFIKPQLVSEKNPASYPATKLCFDLASEIEDMSDLDWVAAIGVIGDCAFNSWKDFLDSVFSKYKIEKKQDLFETSIGKSATLMSDAECVSKAKAAESFEVVYNAKSPDDVLNSSLKKYQEAVESERQYWLGHLEEFAEQDENFIFYLIKPKYEIKSSISTILSLEHPHKTIILVQDINDGNLYISARRRDEKVAANELLENCIKGLENATAGGHVPAAGGTIRKEDLSKFKKNLFNELKNK